MSTWRFADRLEELHRRAEESCGWDDFGEREYLPGMRTYARALDRTAQLPETTREIVAEQIVGILRGRLYAEHFRKRYPAFAAQRISKPIFIIGLPRSGTTALHRMLAADPRLQRTPRGDGAGRAGADGTAQNGTGSGR